MIRPEEWSLEGTIWAAWIINYTNVPTKSGQFDNYIKDKRKKQQFYRFLLLIT